MIKKFTSVIVLFIIVLLCLFAYWDLPKTFFQQDEWQLFGSNIFALNTKHPFLNVMLPFEGQLTHFYPLGTLFFLVEQIMFGINAAPYLLVNLFLHAIVVGMFFYLVKTLTGKNTLAILAAVFFLINSRGNQVLTWIAAGLGTLPSVIFLLLTVIFFIRFLSNEKKIYLLFFSVLSFVISLLFKEISLSLFVFLPISLFIYSQRLKFKNVRNISFPFFLLFIFYGFIRLVFLFFSVRSSQPEMGDVSLASSIVYLFRFFAVPLKSFSQSFFSQNFLVSTSDKLVHIAYPQFVASDGAANPYVSQLIAFDLASFILTVLILALIFIFYKYFKNKNERQLTKSILFFLFFSLTAFLPFIFIPGKGGYFSIIEPRNLYVPVMSSSFFIALFFYCFPKFFFKKEKIAKVITFFLAAAFIMINIANIRVNVSELKDIGNLRQSFLETIENSHSSLPKNVVFYIQSDSAYYGLPDEEKNLPVQSGFGRMLMVSYQNKEKFPGCLYEDQFLHDLTAQGYRACGGRGFGYFRDYDKFKETVKKENISRKEIIAYEWNSKAQTFKDITKAISSDLTNK